MVIPWVLKLSCYIIDCKRFLAHLFNQTTPPLTTTAYSSLTGRTRDHVVILIEVFSLHDDIGSARVDDHSATRGVSRDWDIATAQVKSPGAHRGHYLTEPPSPTPEKAPGRSETSHTRGSASSSGCEGPEPTRHSVLRHPGWR